MVRGSQTSSMDRGNKSTNVLISSLALSSNQHFYSVAPPAAETLRYYSRIRFSGTKVENHGACRTFKGCNYRGLNVKPTVTSGIPPSTRFYGAKKPTLGSPNRR